MTDFLDCIRPEPVLVTTCRIECDTERCPSCIVVSHSIDAAQAEEIATAACWQVKRGAMRDYHWCPDCREWSKR